MKIKGNKGEWTIDVAVWTCLIIFCFICLYPFWFIIVASFNNGYDMMAGGVYWWPREFTLDNYTDFFSQANWLSAIQVSLSRAGIGAVCTTLFTCMVSYAISRKDLLFGKTYRSLFVICMYVSGGLIPFYMVLRFLGIINTFYVYILPALLNLFFVMVGMNFFRSIPDSLIEVAHLDGASDFKIFFKIVLPLSTPYIATLALFSCVNQWNSWLDSVYYVSDKNLRPMAYWMVSMMNQNNYDTMQDLGNISQTQLTTQATAVVATITPILLVYPFLQKYFVQGMMVGSVKE